MTFIENLFNLLKSLIIFLAKNWLIVIVIFVALLALAKFTAMRKNRKFSRKQSQNSAMPNGTIDYRSGTKVAGRVVMLINQRLSLDNTDDMAWLKGQYQILERELRKKQNIDVDPANLTNYYLQHYQDTSSELVDRMKQLERIVYGEE